MEVERRLMGHYKRWNIQFSYEEQFEKFKNRLIKILNNSIGNSLASTLRDVDQCFSKIVVLHKAELPSVRTSEFIMPTTSVVKNILADTQRFLASGEITQTERGFGDTHVYRHIKESTNSKELASLVQFLFFALEDKYDELQTDILRLIESIKQISLLTPSVSFQIYTKDKQVTLYPLGDDFLDTGIINYTLSGLEAYPNAAKEFEAALKIYMEGDTSRYRNLLDNLRFAYEQLLKKVLGDRSLENQKNELLKYLDKKILHKEVRQLHHALFLKYIEYQNDAVKHGEKFSLDEVEFMIYLTGNFIRLILQLENEESDSQG